MTKQPASRPLSSLVNPPGETYSVYVRVMPKARGEIASRELLPGIIVDRLDGQIYGVEILDAWTVEVDGRDVVEQAKRAWWWPARKLTNPRQLFLRGGDEFGNHTIGIRLPGGMLIVALNVPLRRELWDPELKDAK